MKDRNGRTYARLRDCKPGTKLQADDGFECIESWKTLTVKARKNGQLYVQCEAVGGHNLDGQIDSISDDSLIGLYPAP
jgi:hypothetical protein